MKTRIVSRLRSVPAVAGLCLGALLAVSGAAFAADPAPPSEEAAVKVSIGAGPLDQSLQKYAERMGLQLVYAPELVAGLTSRGVSGTLTAREGLARLLSGTGLTYRFVGERTATLERVKSTDARVLGPVRVEGAQETPVRIGEGVATLGGERGHQEDETRGYRPVVSSVGSGRPIPIEDNPRSVSVLTREQMEDQGVNDIGEALARLPGVTVSDGIYSRGQKIERLQIDGGSALDLSNVVGRGGLTPTVAAGPELGDRLNLAAYENVELLRGGNAAFIGNGSLGGTLNLVRKRPGSVPAETVSFTAGSWSRFEGLYDVTVPNIGGSNIAFRGVTDLQTSEAFYDEFKRKNGLVYGIVDVPLSSTSRGEIGVRYSNSQTDSPYLPVIRYADGPLIDLPRTTNFGPKWGYADVAETELFTRIKTDFSDAWTVDVGLSWLHGVTDELYAGLPANATLLSNGQKSIYPTTIEGTSTSIVDADTRTLTGDVRLSGRFVTWGITHNVFAQAAYYDFQNSAFYQRWKSFNRTVQSINDYFLDDLTGAPYPTTQYGWSERRVQGSIEDLLTWNDMIDLRLALGRNASNRFEYTPPYNTGQTPVLVDTNTSNSRTRSDWTPSYSVVFKPWRGLSIAPSFAEGTTSQSSFYTPAGELLGPAVYKNQELMMRYATARWVASTSYYNNDNSNVAEAIPGVRTCAPTGTSQCYSEGVGTVSSKGYDLELAGELFHELTVSASYNYNETKYLASAGVSADAPVNTQSPARTAKLFLSWKPQFMPKWSLSAGYSRRSDIYASGRYSIYDAKGVRIGSQNYNYVNKGYDLFDLGLRYAATPSLDVSLLAENLTDESYLLTTNQTTGSYGRPRNFSLNVKWKEPSIARWGGEGSVRDHFPLGDPAGWYTALDLGSHTSSTVTAKSPKASSDGSPVEWDYELGSNFLTFWRIGRGLAPHWRLELEAGFRPTDIKNTVTAGPEPRGLCSVVTGAPAYPNCRPETGKFDTYTAMVNGLYAPWGEQKRVAPFVGLGLGLAVSQVEIGGRLTTRQVASKDIIAGIDETVLKPAAQVIAGLTLKLMPRLNADLTYRYLYVPDVKWNVSSDYYNGTQAAPYGLDHFKGDLDDQSVTLAFRWTFDAGSR